MRLITGARSMRKQLIQAGIAFGIASLLAACGSAGIYANVSTAGPTVDLGPVHVPPGVNLGYQPSASPKGF